MEDQRQLQQQQQQQQQQPSQSQQQQQYEYNPPPPTMVFEGAGHPLQSASSYTDLPFLFGVQDPNLVTPTPLVKGGRRRSQTGELIKHRRTRSGCFMCRTRRVKARASSPVPVPG